MSDLQDQLVGAVSRGRRLEASKLESVSMKTRNLSALNFKLAAARAVQDAAKAVRKQREEGLDELGFTPWRTISRIAKTGGHIVVIVDGVLDQGRWSELEVLLYRLRGNDGSNIKPIVVVSKSPPAVQDLILWRSIDVFVTQGCVSDHEAAQALGFDRAHSIVLLADACSSDNPLLMDRRVLLATSVLEREDELTPDHMLPKMVLSFTTRRVCGTCRKREGSARSRADCESTSVARMGIQRGRERRSEIITTCDAEVWRFPIRGTWATCDFDGSARTSPMPS